MLNYIKILTPTSKSIIFIIWFHVCHIASIFIIPTFFLQILGRPIPRFRLRSASWAHRGETPIWGAYGHHSQTLSYSTHIISIYAPHDFDFFIYAAKCPHALLVFGKHTHKRVCVYQLPSQNHKWVQSSVGIQQHTSTGFGVYSLSKLVEFSTVRCSPLHHAELHQDTHTYVKITRFHLLISLVTKHYHIHNTSICSSDFGAYQGPAPPPALGPGPLPGPTIRNANLAGIWTPFLNTVI
jgi:hypothetical protein